jgi:hypothetical protein
MQKPKSDVRAVSPITQVPSCWRVSFHVNVNLGTKANHPVPLIDYEKFTFNVRTRNRRSQGALSDDQGKIKSHDIGASNFTSALPSHQQNLSSNHHSK